jgi:hypothetical protein
VPLAFDAVGEHAKPKAANTQQSFFYDFSNYGIHDRSSHDGIIQSHQERSPSFLLTFVSHD